MRLQRDLAALSRRVAAMEPHTPVLAVLRPLAEVEREHILATLKACEGRVYTAAKSLGMSVQTLYRRLKKWEGNCG